MSNKEKGFTLIELVVVIVILGILAATAVPRFAEMSVQARQAARDGVEGAVRSASALAHAQALVQGITTGTITMEGVGVALVSGYPSEAGIGSAVDVGGNASFAGGSPAAFQIDGDTECTVTYTESTGTGVAPVIGGDSTCDG